MPHDIIDNRELHLADAVRPLLTESVRAHFAVGCFFLSGFKAIAEQLAGVEELRLLIGNTSDRATIGQLAEGHASREAIIAQQGQRPSRAVHADRPRRFSLGGEDVMQTSRRDHVGGGKNAGRVNRAP